MKVIINTPHMVATLAFVDRSRLSSTTPFNHLALMLLCAVCWFSKLNGG